MPRWITIPLLACLASSAAAAQVFVDLDRSVAIAPSRGADPRVDYAALVHFGPWDDRNYALTQEDLAVLAPNEAELSDPVPAFFRVEMRKAWPSLQRTGPAQYPRSALQIFRQMFGGYLVRGEIFTRARRVEGRFYVVLEGGVPLSEADAGPESLSGEVRVTRPEGAAESAIKVNPANPDEVVAGTNGPAGGQRMHWSADGGETWTQVDLPLGGTCCDPAVDWSADGAYAYTTTLGNCGFFGCQVWFYRSDDGGRTWTSLEDVTPGDPRREIATSSADKEYLHVDKHPSSPYKDRIYVTWHESNVMQFAVSSDFGHTFSTQSFSSDSADRGIGSDITTDGAGRVYYFWPGTSSRTIRLRQSTNGGASFGSVSVVANTQASFDFPVPSMETREVFVYVSADADLSGGTYDGSVYAAWTDSTAPTTGDPAANHARIQVARSRDGGATWSVTTPHETSDQLSVDRWHPWLAVGPDGAVHVVFYDTRRDPSRESVDLYYSFSTDGAETWSVPERVTTVLSPNIADSFEFGDYNGLDIVMSRLIAVFTDNRSESGGTTDSIDVYAAGLEPGGGAVCGNGELEPGESCDGADFGGQTCLDFGCEGGTLTCAGECSEVDTSSCTGCTSGAGRVPGARDVAGDPLRLTRSGGDVTLTWSVACGSVGDYAVYEGELGVTGSLVSRTCSTGGETTFTLTPSPGQRYFLVVATDNGTEGSYGRQSDDLERAAAPDACLPQEIGECP